MKKILATAMILASAVAALSSAEAADPKAPAKPVAKVDPKAAPAKPAKAPLTKKVKAPPTFWGNGRELDATHAGDWSRKYAMRKGYLARVIGRACGKHKGACAMLQDTHKALNAAFGQCGGFWPTLRMTLTSLAKGVSRGSAVQLGPDLAKPLAVIKGACAAARAGGRNALQPVFQALKAAAVAFKKKKATGFASNVRMALSWLKKPGLWLPPGAKNPVAPAAKP